MSNTIIPKRSSVAGKAPLATNLEIGEIAVNLTDGLIFSKNASGTVITLGGSGGGGGGGDLSLPSQTGNAGKFLSTDGANASWTVADFLPLTGGSITGNVTVSGGVGIGGTATRKLTVIGTGTDARILISDSDSTYAASVAILEFGGSDGRGAYVGINNSTLQLYAEPSVTDTIVYAGAVERLRANASGVSVLNGSLSLLGTLGTAQINANGDQLAFTKDGYNYLTASGASATMQVQASGASGKVVLSTAGADRLTVSATGVVNVPGTLQQAGNQVVHAGNVGSYALSVSGGATGAGQVPVGTTAQRPAVGSNGMIRYNDTSDVFEVYSNAAWRYIPTGDTIIQASTNGEATFTNPGTYSWICPADVTAVSVVCVGGGGGSIAAFGGGGGGGLAWCNNIPVTPGTSYTVVVGAGGLGSTATTAAAGSGGPSYFLNSSTVYAGGGSGGPFAVGAGGTGGSYNVVSNYGTKGGGVGGVGGGSNSTVYNGGGGGAGGYSGAGGNGAVYSGAQAAGGAGSGGGGGGGGTGDTDFGGGGGGVGIYGQDTNGAGGTGAATGGYRGGGGSGGVGGGLDMSAGGQFGGGAAPNSSNGGGGAVRIIWGPSRAFPSTNTGIL